MPPLSRDHDPAGDLALVRAAIRGEGEAREALARRLTFVLRILIVLNRRHGQALSPHDVEDLAQDTFLLAWRKLGAFHGETELEGWLYRFCALEYLNRVRRRSRALPPSAVALDEVAGSTDEDCLDERSATLDRCLVELGPPDEEVIRLKHFEGLSFESIATRLAAPASTIKTRYYHGLAWLQRRLGGARREVEA